MTKETILEICKERFSLWTQRFMSSNATPQIALGVAHGRDRDGRDQSGQIVLCVVDDPEMTSQVIAGFLRYAADMLEGKIK